MSDLVSIIVPIYCVEEYLSKCIDSIINQIEGMCVNIVSAKREGWN